MKAQKHPRPRRLIDVQAALYERPCRDPIEAARVREENRRRAIVPLDPAAWTPEEIGKAVSMCLAGAYREDIAAAVGRPVEDIARRIAALQRSIAGWQRRNAKRSGHAITRKAITEEQLRKAAELRVAAGLSWDATAEAVGATTGQVRYVLLCTDHGHDLLDEAKRNRRGGGAA